MAVVKALILGIVEGLTEFLPISSTGHLILAGDLLDFDQPSAANVFNIVIQTGAMLAVVWEYRARFFRVDLQLCAQSGGRFHSRGGPWVSLLENTSRSICSSRAGGARLHRRRLIILLGGAQRNGPHRVETARAMTWLDALKVGFAQCFALIPGTSRSGATIIGGMLFGLSRQAATEFSFFLAVPTLIAAGAYDLRKNRELCLPPTMPACWRRLGGGFRLGVRGDPLADPLRGDARLQAVRLVPDRLRRRGAGYGLFRLGELDAQRQGGAL